MDRRFLTWLMLTTALFFFYISFRPQNPQQPNQPPAVPPAEQDPLLRADGGKIDGEDQAEIGAASELAETETAIEPERTIVLGSMAAADNYNMLVTLTNSGAGIERVELVSRKPSGKFTYRALEHDGGYLGYLGLVENSEGLRIRSVPKGSPAALATSQQGGTGLQPDDVILEFAGQASTTVAVFLSQLEDLKPAEQVEIKILRDVSGTPTTYTFTATLSQTPLDILRMRPWRGEEIAGNINVPSFRTTLASLETTRVPEGKPALPALAATLEGNWQVSELEVEGGQGVEFRMPLSGLLEKTGRPSKLVMVKRYRLYPVGENNPDGYLLDLETVVLNENDAPVTLALRQEGANGLTLEGWWYSVKLSQSFFAGAGQRDVMFSNVSGHQLSTTRDMYSQALKTPLQPSIPLLSENESNEVRSLKYIGLDSPYFAAAMIPHDAQPDALNNLAQAASTAVANAGNIPKAKSQATNTAFWFDTQAKTIEAGGSISQRYSVFIGPKDTELLSAHGLDEAVYYGWFKWVAVPLSVVLHFFYGIVRNYGLAIIMLTVVVRGLMFPLGRKAAMNAQRMQELQPEMKKINDRYKDDMQKRAKAMQDLYAKHNFKPLAGCAPMFIQLPIFMGLYRCLSVDISLRQEPLFPWTSWCSNLAAPDQLANWSTWMPEFFAGRGTGWLGPYFNILPLVTVALFLAQQKMLMPKATDEQTAMTQKMMQFMTLFMGVLFFKVPAGLCIYFVTSSLWSLVERQLVKKTIPKTKGAAPAEEPEEPAKPKNNNRRRKAGSSNESEQPKSRFSELSKMLDKPNVKSATQRGSSKSRGNNKSKKKKR